jgi:hypothetical protein
MDYKILKGRNGYVALKDWARISSPAERFRHYDTIEQSEPDNDIIVHKTFDGLIQEIKKDFEPSPPGEPSSNKT